jgi:hypothetical protein
MIGATKKLSRQQFLIYACGTWNENLNSLLLVFYFIDIGFAELTVRETSLCFVFPYQPEIEQS